MSGITEILIIVALVLGIFILPRTMGRNLDIDRNRSNHVVSISGWIRLAIVVSILWPALVAFFLRPWNNQWDLFLYVAFGPVGLSWGVCWMLWGFKNGK